MTELNRMTEKRKGFGKRAARRVNVLISDCALDQYTDLSIPELELVVADLKALSGTNCGWDLHRLTKQGLLALAEECLADKKRDAV